MKQINGNYSIYFNKKKVSGVQSSVVGSYPNEEEGECLAILNVELADEEEISQIRWDVNGQDIVEYNGNETITHNLKEEETYEIT